VFNWLNQPKGNRKMKKAKTIKVKTLHQGSIQVQTRVSQGAPQPMFACEEKLRTKLRTLFRNNSDCYADTWKFDNDGNKIEGAVIQAMTEDKFVELLSKQTD